MDFVYLTPKVSDTIQTIVDRLTKSSHFLAIKMNDLLISCLILYLRDYSITQCSSKYYFGQGSSICLPILEKSTEGVLS